MLKRILIVVGAVMLVAGSVSAQTAPTGPAPEAPKAQPTQTGPTAPAAAPESGTPGSGHHKRGGHARGAMTACQTDLATFCKDAAPGGRGSRWSCLQENQAKLDPACKAALTQAREHSKGMREACKSDRETLCKDAERGGGKMAQCLKANADKLSPGCREAIVR